MKIPIQELPTNQLNALISEWSDALQIKQGQNLKLDLSRGKPSYAQLELSHKISNQPIENYFSSDGNFKFDLLKNIKQFPNTEFFEGNINSLDDASNSWLYAQKKIKDQTILNLKDN